MLPKYLTRQRSKDAKMTAKPPIVVRFNHHRNPWPDSLGQDGLGRILKKGADAMAKELMARIGTEEVATEADLEALGVALVLLDPTDQPTDLLAKRILATVTIGNGERHLPEALAVAWRAQRYDGVGGNLRVHNIHLADGEFIDGEAYEFGGVIAAAYGSLDLVTTDATELCSDLAEEFVTSVLDGVEMARRHWLEAQDPSGQQCWLTADGRPSRTYTLAVTQFASGGMPGMEPLTIRS